jgi:maltose O-acetyltransferase
MLSGELYLGSDPGLAAGHRRARRLTEEFNRTTVDAPAERNRILRELLAEFGEDSEVRPPFHCDYGSQIRMCPDLRQLRARRPRPGTHQHRQ